MCGLGFRVSRVLGFWVYGPFKGVFLGLVYRDLGIYGLASGFLLGLDRE